MSGLLTTANRCSGERSLPPESRAARPFLTQPLERAPLFLLFLQEVISDRSFFPAGILRCRQRSEVNNSGMMTVKADTWPQLDMSARILGSAAASGGRQNGRT